MTRCARIKRFIKLSAAAGATAVLIGILALLILCFAGAVSPLFFIKSTNITSINISKTVHVAIFTLVQAILSTLIALAAGLPAAFWTGKRDFWGRRFLLSLSSIPVCIPSLIIALGYVSFFGINGSLNRFLMYISGTAKPPVTFLYTMAGIIIAQGFYNFPLIMGTVSDYWAGLKSDEADCAKLLGAGNIRIFRTITVYQLMPAVISSAIPVFIFCFFSFMIILLFGSIGCTTLEVEIYQAAKSFLDYHMASFYAVIETVISILMIFIYSSMEHTAIKSKNLNTNASFIRRKKIKGMAERLLFLLFIIFVTLFFLLPLAGIVINAITSGNVGKTAFTFNTIIKTVNMRGFTQALDGTLKTAIFTSLLCSLAAFTYAVYLREKESRSTCTILKTLPVIPMTISGVVLGLGLTILVQRGTVLHLILAQTVITWPIAFRQIYPYLSKLDQDVIYSSKLLSQSVTDTIFKVYLPYARRGILSSMGFCFAISAGDTTLPLILSIPRFDTLSLFTYRLAGSYKFHESCCAGLILGFICAAVFHLADRIKGHTDD